MTAVLPQGLINANAAIPPLVSDESSVNFTNSEVLRKFWRVYAIQSAAATQDNTAERSRNLFWRVWSSPALTSSVRPDHLTWLWRRCGQEFDLSPIGGLPTLTQAPVVQDFPTPRQSRKRSASLSPSTEVRPVSDSSPRQDQNVDSSFQEFRWSNVSQQPGGGGSRPPLRAAREVGGQKSDSTSGSTSQTTSDSSTKPALSRTASGGRQRLPVVATTGKTRTRPSLPPRKSSIQKPAGGGSQAKSPRIQPESAVIESPNAEARAARLAVIGPPPGLPMPPASGRAFVMPAVSSWQSVESTSPNHLLATTAPIQATTSRELVDPGFRGKFVENQKMLASSTNLVGLDRMRRPGSIVRFADELPLEDIGKGKERETPASPLRDENSRSTRLQTSMASAAISDDSDTESASSGQLELPRTKSQLSVLIQHKRTETGSSEIGHGPRATESKGKEKEARAKAVSKEEELLSMGRRDGVTKAGGIQVPKQQRVSQQDLGYHSPSSPEPLF